MADRAFVTSVQSVSPDSADNSILILFNVQYFSDIGNMNGTAVECRVLWTDTGAVWLSKMTTTIINTGTEMGYSLLPAQVRIPSYVAGTA